MNYIVNKTKFRHKKWGDGILREIDGTALVIEFPQEGIKKLINTSVQSGFLTVITPESSVEKIANTTNSNTENSIVQLKPSETLPTTITNSDGKLRQYDTSANIVGGKNVLEAFKTDDVVIFNESYTIIGDETSAKKISATYDLTIIGDVYADEIKVNGELTVVGNIFAKVLTCSNNLICRGHVDVEKLSVGTIIAKSVKCIEFMCDSNAMIETTIDIDEFSRTEKTMVACEGIIGAGSFSALNAIANEYFEFSGDITGKIVELESDTVLSEIDVSKQEQPDFENLPIADVIRYTEERLQSEYAQCYQLEEDALVELIKQIGNNSLHNTSDYATIFKELTYISYKDEIDNLGDYLYVLYAKKILPKELYMYETIEHIDSILLPNAEKVLDELEFKPKSVENIVQCINIAKQCADMIFGNIDEILDKIFSSIGIRYSTVKKILDRTVAAIITNTTSVITPTVEVSQTTQKTESTIDTKNNIAKTTSTIASETEAPQNAKAIQETESAVDMFDVELAKPKKLKLSRNQFLKLSIQARGKFFGITAEEQMRLASAKIKTCGDFLRMSEQDMREIFKKKLFLVNHLYQAQQKMKAAVEEMDEE